MSLELSLQLALGPAVMATRGFAAPEAEIAYRRAHELAGTLGDNRSLFAAVWGEWLVTGQVHGHGPVRPLVDELFRVAKQLDDPALELQAHHAAWATDTDTGNLTNAREHVAKGLQIYDPKTHGSHALLYGGHDPAVCGLGQGAVGLWVLGYPEQAMASARQGISLGQTLTHRPSLGHALWFAGVVYMLGGETNIVLDLAERLVTLSSELGLGQYRATGRMMRGWARARSETRVAGLAELRVALVDYLRTAAVFGNFYTSALVEAELACGQFDQATAAANSAIERKGDEVWRSRLLRARADVHMAGDAPDLRAAEGLYSDALSQARSIGARSFELEAALGLARLWTLEGRKQEARNILEPVYSWFSEGFETTNLKEARAVLEQIR